MHELINFSTHTSDIERFSNDWSAVAAYVAEHNLAGVELLTGSDPPPPNLPPGLVQAVHLPFWISWLEVWRGATDLPKADPAVIRWIYGGFTADELVATQRQIWQHAATLNPAYMVFHVSHSTVHESFAQTQTTTDAEVCCATADLLNAVAATFPGGEPPARLFLENLWWPGLTFRDPSIAELLAERLQFTNWAFVLDTGHLMNTNPLLEDEEHAIAFVLTTIERLDPAIRARIEGTHLSLSLSGAQQRATWQRGQPAGFETMDFIEQYRHVHAYVAQIDQHAAVTSPRCGAIVAAIQPNFVTHEFLTQDLAELSRKINAQRAALHATY